LLTVAIRWGTFIAVLMLIGTAIFRVLILGRLLDRFAPVPATAGDALRRRLLGAYERRIAAWGLAAAVALLPLAIGRLATQVAELRDPTEPWTSPAAMMLGETVWGIGWWLQVGGALVAAVGFLVARARHDETAGRRDRASRVGWAMAVLGAVALAVTPALSGHAIGSPWVPALAVVGDTLHVLGAGAWLGSLTVMLFMVTSQRGAMGAGDVTPLVQAFSPVALVSAAFVVASGVFASWLHVDAPASLWTTTYGRLLLAKLVLFAGVLALGAFNWRRLTPRLGTEAGVGALRTSARGELAVAVVLLLVTAVLVATPLPGE